MILRPRSLLALLAATLCNCGASSPASSGPTGPRATQHVQPTSDADAPFHCGDNDDPQAWAHAIAVEAHRLEATRCVRSRFEDRMAVASPPNDPHDPNVQRLLDVVLQPLVTSFVEHSDDAASRAEAIEVLAQVPDARVLPALSSAFAFRPGDSDSERLSLRAVQALLPIARAPNGIPAASRPEVALALIAMIDRAADRWSYQQQIRYNAIRALGAMRATESVETLVRLLERPLAEQEISTARAAAEALGEIGDARAADALVYGLFLNIRGQNAFPHCERALVQLGAEAAVPVLIRTLQRQNHAVHDLLAQYANAPGAPPVPEGIDISSAADVLQLFDGANSIDALLAALADQHEEDMARSAVGDALAYIAVGAPAARPTIQRTITAVFRENQPTHLPEGHGWSALLMAPRLAILGDPSSIPVLTAAIRSRMIQSLEHAPNRVDLLSSLATIARHANVAEVRQLANTTRRQLERMISTASPDDREDTEHEVQPFVLALDRINDVIAVAADCNDGDLACYVTRLQDRRAGVVKKAASMIGWTVAPPQRAAALDALVQAFETNPDVLVRRTILVAIERLSPQTCMECVPRLTHVLEAERGQESRMVSHIETLALLARWRARAGVASAAP